MLDPNTPTRLVATQAPPHGGGGGNVEFSQPKQK